MSAQQYQHIELPRGILVVVVMTMVLVLIATLPRVNLPGTSQPDPLTQVYRNPVVPLYSLINTGHTTFLNVEFGHDMPEPPLDICRKLGYDSCRWLLREACFEAGHVGDVCLIAQKKFGRSRIIANSQLVEVRVMDYPDLAHLAQYTDTVWLADVEVVASAQANGLGWEMVKAGNGLLAAMLANEGAHQVAYRLFHDIAGWMNAIMSKIDPALITHVQEGELFVYEVWTR
jgi:hypothetical protein